MNTIEEFFQAIFEPFGEDAPKPRTFIVDMHDAYGNSKYHDVTVVAPPDMLEMELIESIADLFTCRGYTIAAIAEVMDAKNRVCRKGE